MADLITGPGWYVRQNGVAVEITHFDEDDGCWRVRTSNALGYHSDGREIDDCSPIVRRLNVIDELPPLVQEWVRCAGERRPSPAAAVAAVRDLLLPLMPPQPTVEWRLVQDNRGNDEWRAYVGKDHKTTVGRDWKYNRPVWAHGLAREDGFETVAGAKADVEKRLAANGGVS